MAGSSPRAATDWTEAFGYSPADIHSVEIGEFGYPYVPVKIGDDTVVLPLDTGNMVGISVSGRLFDDLELTTAETYNRLNSAGRKVATLRVSRPRKVMALGTELAPQPIYELEHPTLPGLLGPQFLAGRHFTLDYTSRRIGIADGPLPEEIPGFRALPLVRSGRHPSLILVHGILHGRRVLMELDTGKSRTVVHPGLAADLELAERPRGVHVERLTLGDLSFKVLSAKLVDQTAIDPDLPEPIRVGVGSDILSKVVWTVDDASGLLWIPAERREPPQPISGG
jgi:hypothetical protein